MEPLFKVGDVVRVRDLDKIEEETQSGLPFGTRSEMVAMAGQLCTITNVETNIYEASDYPRLECDECRYKISPDRCGWSWSSPMLEKVAEPADLRVDAQVTTTKTNVEPCALTADSWRSYVDRKLYELSSACSVPSALMPKKDDEPLIAVKKHSVKLNFKN